jgi:hypothetical protein
MRKYSKFFFSKYIKQNNNSESMRISNGGIFSIQIEGDI